MRETWLSENQRLVSQDNFGNDLAAVEAATKKHEAIETDIMVRQSISLDKLYRYCCLWSSEGHGFGAVCSFCCLRKKLMQLCSIGI